MNWRLAAAGLGIIALVVVLAIWRSGGSSVVVAGTDAEPTVEGAAAQSEAAEAANESPSEEAPLSSDEASSDDPCGGAQDGPDADADGVVDLCDPDPTDGPAGDPDGDGVPSSEDNCDSHANSDQADLDGDGTGDACDTSDDRPSSAAPSADNDAADGGDDTGSGSDDGSAQTEEATGAGPGSSSGDMRCILYLHGAGTGPDVLRDEVWADDLLYLTPHSGNNEFPFFWLYDGPHDFANDPDDSDEPFDQIVSRLTDYLDTNDCGPVMMHGESNGGGLAARIYCSGEDFGGRLWMAIVDDPVPDAGVVGCSPSPSVQRSLFIHSTMVVTLAESFVDNRCSISDEVEYPWYCMDDIGFDLEEYEAHIGQESVRGREEHIGVNDDSVNFWSNVTQWWESLDSAAYAQQVG